MASAVRPRGPKCLPYMLEFEQMADDRSKQLPNIVCEKLDGYFECEGCGERSTISGVIKHRSFCPRFNENLEFEQMEEAKHGPK